MTIEGQKADVRCARARAERAGKRRRPQGRTILWTIAAVYLAVAVAVFAFNVYTGPVTPRLALLRGALWPATFLGMIPGERMSGA
jgi:hypothetical protein